MPWGSLELEPEVRDWLAGLSSRDFGRAAFSINLLESQGVHLDEPYTRQLQGKLRELRFYLGRTQVRLTYFILPERRIVLLTVFSKQSRREAREIARAAAAMERCLAEGHTVVEAEEEES